MTAPRPIDFTIHADERGSLAAFECNTNLPFDLHRAFLVFGVPTGEMRGGHAHHNGHELLVAVSGSCTARSGGCLYSLSGPKQGLYIPPGVRVDLIDFTPDCVLLAFCDTHYDPNDHYDPDQ